MARGRLAEAEAHFRRCLQAHAGHARAILGLGRLAYLRGDLQEAENRLSAAASDSRSLNAASAVLVEVHHRAGDRAKAGRLLAGLSEMRDDPPWPDPLIAEVERMEVGRKRSLSVAIALMRAHRLREAITLLRQTLDQYPHSERVLLLLGLAHNMADDWSEGEKVLRQAAPSLRMRRAPAISSDWHWSHKTARKPRNVSTKHRSSCRTMRPPAFISDVAAHVWAMCPPPNRRFARLSMPDPPSPTHTGSLPIYWKTAVAAMRRVPTFSRR
jgi:tetratricopeptide (TPR) repeat protein